MSPERKTYSGSVFNKQTQIRADQSSRVIKPAPCLSTQELRLKIKHGLEPTLAFRVQKEIEEFKELCKPFFNGGS